MDKAYDRLPTQRSRELRNNATPAERKLWLYLRKRQTGGMRFSRQVPIGPFICDFVARSARLIVEVDGGQHDKNRLDDQKRTTFLQQRGYRVVRFWNNDVLENTDGVLGVIEEALMNMPPELSRRVEARGSR